MVQAFDPHLHALSVIRHILHQPDFGGPEILGIGLTLDKAQKSGEFLIESS